MQSRKKCSVKGSCSAVTKLYRCTQQTQSISVSSLPTSSRVSRAGTRNLREGRASSDRMRSNITSALSTTERGMEKDSQQRIANNVGRALRCTQSCLRLYDLRGAVCATKHVGQHITQGNKNTAVTWPHKSPHQTPSLASFTGWAGSLAASTCAQP